eukprot:6177333-Pleurochrysis_carterae.AAC.2
MPSDSLSVHDNNRFKTKLTQHPDMSVIVSSLTFTHFNLTVDCWFLARRHGGAALERDLARGGAPQRRRGRQSPENIPRIPHTRDVVWTGMRYRGVCADRIAAAHQQSLNGSNR